MTKSYFTFGQKHKHTIKDKVYDKDCVVEIYGEDGEENRKKMFETFGAKWSFAYDKKPDMSFYPRGIMKLAGGLV